jgi:hypothetical protein
MEPPVELSRYEFERLYAFVNVTATTVSAISDRLHEIQRTLDKVVELLRGTRPADGL